MQHEGIPDSFEQLIDEYDEMISKFIRSISLNRIRREDFAELKQSVYLRLLEQDTLAVARRQIPERGGQFSSYVYTIVNSVVVNAFVKWGRSPLSRCIDTAYAPSSGGDGEDEDQNDAIDMLVANQQEGFSKGNLEEQVVAWDWLNQFDDHLKQMERRMNRKVSARNGVTVRRSLRTVFHLWYQLGTGPSPAGRMERELAVQMAQLLGLTPQTVNHFVLRLRKEAKAFGR